MHNLIEYSDTYSKIFERLWQYYRYKAAVNNSGGVIVDFDADNVTDSCNPKVKITGQTDDNDGTKKCCNDGTIKILQ